MAYNNQKQLPKKDKVIGNLWKPTQPGGDALVSGYLNLGIDANLKIAVKKNKNIKNEKSPQYVLVVEVTDWQTNAPQAPAAPSTSEDDIPF